MSKVYGPWVSDVLAMPLDPSSSLPSALTGTSSLRFQAKVFTNLTT